ncbi:MAG: septation protein A [Magnetococcales bacterium]|nr:septation protein A [Magnetococcales bacterium]
MKFLLEMLPVVLFFLVYKWDGIYSATLTIMVALALQVAHHRWRYGKVEPLQGAVLALALIFGGATLTFQDPQFIQWKPTILQWVLAAAFALSPLVTGEPLIERMLRARIHLPKKRWRSLNIAWTLFFLFSGGANLFVATHYDENTWVNFKMFGLLGLTIMFVMAQALYIARFGEELPDPAKEENTATTPDPPSS